MQRHSRSIGHELHFCFIVTRPRDGRTRDRSSVSSRENGLFSSLLPTQPCTHCESGALSQMLKQPGRKTDSPMNRKLTGSQGRLGGFGKVKYIHLSWRESNQDSSVIQPAVMSFVKKTNKRYSSPQNRSRRPRGGVQAELYSFFNLSTRWGGWSTPRPGRFTPGKETRHPLYRWLGGPQGRSGRVRNISPPTGIRSTDRPAA
jgi:hypothetical protein